MMGRSCQSRGTGVFGLKYSAAKYLSQICQFQAKAMWVYYIYSDQTIWDGIGGGGGCQNIEFVQQSTTPQLKQVFKPTCVNCKCCAWCQIYNYSIFTRHYQKDITILIGNEITLFDN